MDEVTETVNSIGFSKTESFTTAFIIAGSIILLAFIYVWIRHYILGNGLGVPSSKPFRKKVKSDPLLPEVDERYLIPEEASEPPIRSGPAAYLKGVREFNTAEVYNIKNNETCYPDAQKACQKYGGRLATKEQLETAYKKGANWCNLGWSKDQGAYYPTQKNQVAAAQKWPDHFKDGCGREGVNGGFYPAQLKLSVNCYGKKPTDTKKINPWNTLTGQWSSYS